MRYQERIEDANYRAPRGLDRAPFLKLTSNDWIRKHRNCLIVGPAGPEVAARSATGSSRGLLSSLLWPATLVDRIGARSWRRTLRQTYDFGPEVPTAEQRRDLLEIVEDRYNLHSLLITSPIPIPQWYDIIGNSTLADAILDRIVHNACRIELSGENPARSHRRYDRSRQPSAQPTTPP